jgi:hypothetical protein
MFALATMLRFTRDQQRITSAIHSPNIPPLTQAVQSNGTLSNMLPHAG